MGSSNWIDDHKKTEHTSLIPPLDDLTNPNDKFKWTSTIVARVELRMNGENSKQQVVCESRRIQNDLLHACMHACMARSIYLLTVGCQCSLVMHLETISLLGKGLAISFAERFLSHAHGAVLGGGGIESDRIL